MKNILLLSNIYPNNDPQYGGTAVCHSFTKEWVSMGYNVRVVHFDSLFPKPYYWIGCLFQERIQAKTGTVAYTKTPRQPCRYKVDDIPVLFMPLKKIIPHKAPSLRQAQKAFQYIVNDLQKDNFVPDVVTAHFVMPQLQFLPLFKKQYPGVKTCMVLHGNSSTLSYYYPNDYQELMLSVDVWGFRSQAFKDDFNHTFGNYPKEFICYSGIPNKFLSENRKRFSGKVSHFAFVGSLFKLKNVDVAIQAVHSVMGDNNFTFDIIGSGAEYDKIRTLVKNLNIEHKVIFHGQKSRDEAQKILNSAECFVMVSSREAFGLVYVEAMAKGLITVGTKGQGIDGVIKDGINGFLCEANSVDTLAEVIKKVILMSQEELQKMSNLAIETAKALTDSKVAEHYINSIINEF